MFLWISIEWKMMCEWSFFWKISLSSISYALLFYRYVYFYKKSSKYDKYLGQTMVYFLKKAKKILILKCFHALSTTLIPFYFYFPFMQLLICSRLYHSVVFNLYKIYLRKYITVVLNGCIKVLPNWIRGVLVLWK